MKITRDEDSSSEYNISELEDTLDDIKRQIKRIEKRVSALENKNPTFM